MTRNQIEFLKHLETKRSNTAQEIELHRANVVRESQGQQTIDETVRHNKATEGFTDRQLQEQGRHNLATERVAELTFTETARANRAREQLTASANAETARANRAREQLTAEAQAETRRSNLAREAETLRSNRANEAETARANRAREAETNRANLSNEQLKRDQLSETIRFNTAQIDQGQQRLDEQHRTNVAHEVIDTVNQVTNAGRLAETVRHDLAVEAETTRHNLAYEIAYATKDFGTHVRVEGDTNKNTLSLPSGQKQLNSPDSNRDAGKTSGSTSEPVVLKREEKSVPRGVHSIGDALTGSAIKHVRETMSDGSIRYYEEVVRNGKTVSRKEITRKEF